MYFFVPPAALLKLSVKSPSFLMSKNSVIDKDKTELVQLYIPLVNTYNIFPLSLGLVSCINNLSEILRQRLHYQVY